MKIKRFVMGPLDTNGYLLTNDDQCVVIDPSLNCEVLIDAVKESGTKLQAVLLTHSHFDHYLGIHEILNEFGDIPIYLHDNDRIIITNPEFNGATWIGRNDGYEGKTIHYDEGTNSVGEFTFEVIDCPGHTPGGVSLLFGNDCFTGDTLFRGSVGRTDWEYCDPKAMFRAIEENLFTLPDETVVWSGHGPETTIGNEKQSNPYL